MPYSDIGRELYIGSQMSNGEVLYKDIFNVYAPLGYIFNQAIICILGNKIETFKLIGLFLSVMSAIPVFLISRQYFNKLLSFFITITIIPACMYFPSASSWILPYSYSVLWALCFLLWSVYLLLKFYKTDKNYNLNICLLLFGFSLCCKYEFALVLIPILAVILQKKYPFSSFFKSLIYIFIAPIVSIIVLFLQKCTVNDLLAAYSYIKELSLSKEVFNFYYFYGFIPSFESIRNALLSFVYISPEYEFRGIGYLNFIILIFYLIKAIKEKNYRYNNIILLSGIAFFASIKVFGSINFSLYGTYFFPLLFISLIYVLHNKIFKKKTIISVLFCLIIFCWYSFNTFNQKDLISIDTKMGTIKVYKSYEDTTRDLIKHIEDNTSSNDKILILPEGVLINYLTMRNSDNMIFYLIPPNKKILTDDYIKRRIEETKPKYIYITNIMYPDYHEFSFRKGYGKEIISTIEKHYKYIDLIGEDFQIRIYENML
ncbi:glycosyltransferase family 39 protein [bacterium]|nr:glycosyltransferase family 39 protein [bacterium]